jgi:hypothetical protein
MRKVESRNNSQEGNNSGENDINKEFPKINLADSDESSEYIFML